MGNPPTPPLGVPWMVGAPRVFLRLLFLGAPWVDSPTPLFGVLRVILQLLFWEPRLLAGRAAPPPLSPLRRPNGPSAP
eukprot:5879070-Pyramimonas_sp.AAC.1